MREGLRAGDAYLMTPLSSSPRPGGTKKSVCTECFITIQLRSNEQLGLVERGEDSVAGMWLFWGEAACWPCISLDKPLCLFGHCYSFPSLPLQ